MEKNLLLQWKDYVIIKSLASSLPHSRKVTYTKSFLGGSPGVRLLADMHECVCVCVFSCSVYSACSTLYPLVNKQH